MVNTISFPNLGIGPFRISETVNIFGFSIHLYGLIIALGIILAFSYGLKICTEHGLTKDNITDILLFGLPSSIICARIYYVIFDPDCLDGNIFNIVKLWEGGIAIYGGIIGAVITAYVYCKIKKLHVLNTFDVLCPGLLIGQAVGRWGNFVNAEVFGRETSSLFRMSINSQPAVHPLFLYESLWNVLGLIIVLIFRDKKKANGQVFFFYILWYAMGRLFLEGMREPEFILYLIDGKLGISQAVSALFIILSVFALIFSSIRQNKNKN